MKARAIDQLQANIHWKQSYQNRKELEELTTGRTGVSFIATRLSNRILENSNISAIGYQRRALSPRRSLSRPSPQLSIPASDSLWFLFEKSPQQAPTKMRPQELPRVGGNSMTREEISRAMSRVRARRAASLNKTYTIDGSPCTLITFNSHLKDEDVDSLNVSLQTRGAGTSVDGGCMRGDALSTVLREIDQVPDQELLCESPRGPTSGYIDTTFRSYSREGSTATSARPQAQLGFSTMSLKPFFGESVCLDHAAARHKAKAIAW
ncbi:Hypothetical protein GLP15_491 [Giardia lamblia P15]|uniref:Uncharacterized protein n=1 Tax=Giardia intestinalis (strain P15) TaxID=658858 RepID=E1F6F6_GIAIA|nr:Hypothetical protein GLP15_491 [Giardia lamblia P15]